MSPQERVAALARGEVGYVPPRGKYNKYAEALDLTDLYNFPKNGYDWCDIFYDWLLVECFGLAAAKAMTGQPSRGCGAGCSFSASYYRVIGRWSAEPSVGAQVFFGARGAEHHTGVVVAVEGARVRTVEGNTGYAAGYRGGAVLERSYVLGDASISGYGVPRWELAGGGAGPAAIAEGPLEVDGVLGVLSVAAWQRALGTVADGVVSCQPWECWGNTPSLVAVERSYDCDGSALVRAVQARVGADVDGLMGPQTVRCLQAWLNDRGFLCGEVDGVLGPATARALQRSLNAGAWS